jgi:hypothetical protein
MPVSQRDGDIPQRIQQLLDQRREHQDAIEQIDQKLEQISGLLELPARRGRRGRPPGRPAAAAAPAKRGRPRGKITAEQSITKFVQKQGNPTTREIKEHWRSERRKGTPDNTLSKMVRERKLKRQPLEGQRGSRYVLT